MLSKYVIGIVMGPCYIILKPQNIQNIVKRILGTKSERHYKNFGCMKNEK